MFSSPGNTGVDDTMTGISYALLIRRDNRFRLFSVYTNRGLELLENFLNLKDTLRVVKLERRRVEIMVYGGLVYYLW